MERYAFGIDLAGYTTGRTAVAAVQVGESGIRAWLLRGSALSKACRSDTRLSDIVPFEAKALQEMCSLGPVAIDVPIDLQSVGRSADATFVWQLYKRPIDQALNAMPALADRIGAPYARMQAILTHCQGSLRLGEEIFETYPRASLQWLGMPWKGVKGDLPLHRDARKALCDKLQWCDVATDHDLDAILCAVTAGASLGNRCSEADLRSLITKRLSDSERWPLPQGFILLGQNPPPIASIEEADFNEWIGARL